jgi:hypothetical protein
MVCIGTNTPFEAEEIIEYSLSLLEHRAPCVELQKTRSKESLEQLKGPKTDHCPS